MSEPETGKPVSFLLLSGREFASGSAEWNGERFTIGHYVHMAGKEFDDVGKELRDHMESDKPVAAQISMPVAFESLDGVASPADLISKFARSLGLAQNNIHVVLLNKTSGTPLKKGEPRSKAVAIGFSKMELASYRSMLAAVGAPKASITIRSVNAIGAVRSGMEMGEVPSPILYVSILPSFTRLYVVTPSEVKDLGVADHGYRNLLALIMTKLELKFEGSAARLFFGNIYDFSEMGADLSDPLATKIREKLAGYGGEKPLGLMIGGLPPARTRMLSRHVSMALGINEVNLPILVEAPEGGLPAMPAIGAPSLTQMLMAESGIEKDSAFHLNLSKIPMEAVDYWWNETDPEYGHRYVRIYRGSVIGAENTPIRSRIELPKTAKKSEPEPAERNDAPKPPVKPVRMYRGSPI